MKKRRGDALVLFARAPVPGRVKTRLARDIGAEAAARLYRAMVEDLLAAHRGRSYRLVVATAGHRRAFDGLLDGIDTVAQGRGDLGERLARIFRRLLRERSRVVVAGTDLPDLEPREVHRTLRLLRDRDAVLGPAEDGGYYLIGLKEPADLFSSIPWSTPRVLNRTLRRADRLGLRVALLPERADVDTAEDLRVVAARLSRDWAPRSWELLRAEDGSWLK